MPISRAGGGYGPPAAAVSGPTLGANGGDWDIDGAGTSPQTVTINTQATGSSLIVVTLGRLDNYGTPTDNKGNTLTLLRGGAYAGGLWPGYEMEVYGVANAAGGSSHTITVTKTTAAEESSLIVVEGRGATIQDTSIIAVAASGAGVPLTSSTVTTTGPALLVSAWSGDGGAGTPDQTATPGAGWATVQSLFLGGTAYIQSAVAVRQVSSAGTYSCNWTPVENQGAILFMAAVQ